MTTSFSDVHSFKSSFLDNVLSFDIAYVSAILREHNLNIFDMRYLFLPFQKDDHVSLFVVVGAGNIKSQRKAGSDPRQDFRGDALVLALVPPECYVRSCLLDLIDRASRDYIELWDADRVQDFVGRKLLVVPQRLLAL